MKYTAFLISIVLTITPSFGNAITVESYLDLKNFAEKGQSKEYSLLMTYYFSGMSEAAATAVIANDGELDFGEGGKACIPSPDLLTPDVLQRSLDRKINSLSQRGLDNRFSSVTGGMLALLGLPALFPCD